MFFVGTRALLVGHTASVFVATAVVPRRLHLLCTHLFWSSRPPCAPGLLSFFCLFPSRGVLSLRIRCSRWSAAASGLEFVLATSELSVAVVLPCKHEDTRRTCDVIHTAPFFSFVHLVDLLLYPEVDASNGPGGKYIHMHHGTCSHDRPSPFLSLSFF